MSRSALDAPLTVLPGVKEGTAGLFGNLEIRTLGDLIAHYPSRYEDRDTLSSIEDSWGKTIENPAHIASFLALCSDRGSFTFREREIARFHFTDGKRRVDVAAWSPRHRFFKKGGWYLLTGKLKALRGELSLNLLDYEIFDEETEGSLHLGRIVPIYPSTENLAQKRIRQVVAAALEAIPEEDLDWQVPPALVKERKLGSRRKAVQNTHFPEGQEALQSARAALVYEELFIFQHALARKKLATKSGKVPGRYRAQELHREIAARLPWALTGSQQKALDEILGDLQAPAVMQRLLHGEVGSGKTLVALLSMAFAAGGGRQAVLMAPTDILARQHHRVFTKILAPFGLETELLVSAMPPSRKNEALGRLRSGEAKIAVGTHALFQEEAKYLDLSYVVIDEQHRFGVDQRAALCAKGSRPDLLLMSATPIPQTLSLSIFGDLDVSTLAERPNAGPGRKTKILPPQDRAHAYRFLLDRLHRGEQGFVVFPAIGEEEKPASKEEMRSLLKETARLKEKVFKAVPTAMVHGQLPDEERQKAMESFRGGETKVLFATTVIEVGVDVPDATVMIIESADRFGLSQLHQLRGRVGRGEKAGYVYLLIGAEASDVGRRRLEAFAATEDGFAIAQMDLEIRGPGELLGTRQAGMLRFHLADLVRDFELLRQAREDAQNLVSRPQP